MNDYGSSSADLNFEVGRKGLRTFDVINGRLRSPSSPGRPFFWDDGIAVAECLRFETEIKHSKHKEGEEAPAENCRCGLYAMHTLDELARQYNKWAVNCVTVIACQGTTYIGKKGLRTASAQVVAYWCAESANYHYEVFKKQCPEAVGFADIKEMLKTHGFPEAEAPVDRVREALLRQGTARMGNVSFASSPDQSWAALEPLLKAATPGGIAAIKGILKLDTAS